MNGYKNERMELTAVCEWLDKKGMGDIGEQLTTHFQYHVWNVDGMLRTDVIKDCFNLIDPTGEMFKTLQCNVTTYVSFIPDHIAHID